MSCHESQESSDLEEGSTFAEIAADSKRSLCMRNVKRGDTEELERLESALKKAYAEKEQWKRRYQSLNTRVVADYGTLQKDYGDVKKYIEENAALKMAFHLMKRSIASNNGDNQGSDDVILNTRRLECMILDVENMVQSEKGVCANCEYGVDAHGKHNEKKQNLKRYEEDFRNEAAAVSAKTNDLELQVEQLKLENEALVTAKRNLEAELKRYDERFRSEAAAVGAKINDLEKLVQDLRLENESDATAKRRLEAEMEKVKRSCRRRNDNQKKINDDCFEKLTELQDENEVLTATINSVRAELAATTERENSYRREMRNLQHQVVHLVGRLMPLERQRLQDQQQEQVFYEELRRSIDRMRAILRPAQPAPGLDAQLPATASSITALPIHGQVHVPD